MVVFDHINFKLAILRRIVILKMTQIEAVKEANKYRDKLIGKPLGADPAWKIQDVIFCGSKAVDNVYNKMWQDSMGNVQALSHFPSAGDDYEVFVISHQWSWGSGHLATERLASYLERSGA